MNTNEQGIKKRIGSGYLIGCYTRRPDGSYFTDIRGGEGNLIKPKLLYGNSVKIISGEDLEVDYYGEPLEIGTFYSFNWHLSDAGRIVIDGTASKIDNSKLLALRFEARLNLTGSYSNQ